MTNRKKGKWYWNILNLLIADLLLAGPILCHAASTSVAAEQGVVATLDGQPIYLSEIEQNSAFQIYRLRSSIHSLLESEARKIADQRLLAAEASRQGMTVESLLQKEVNAKVLPLTEQDVDAYLAEHPEEKIKGPETRERIRVYLAHQALIQRRLDFTASLRQKADYRFLVKAPERPRIKVETSGRPWRGAKEAPVVLVHFAHFSSRLCAESAEKIQRIMEAFTGRIRWVHRDFFSIQDTETLNAAELGQAAFDEGKFWEYHDQVMALGGRLTGQSLYHAADSLNLDLKRLEAQRKEGKYILRIKEDIGYGVEIGIQAAPVIFVNGIYFSSTFPYEDLKSLVEKELNKL